MSIEDGINMGVLKSNDVRRNDCKDNIESLSAESSAYSTCMDELAHTRPPFPIEEATSIANGEQLPIIVGLFITTIGDFKDDGADTITFFDTSDTGHEATLTHGVCGHAALICAEGVKLNMSPGSTHSSSSENFTKASIAVDEIQLQDDFEAQGKLNNKSHWN
jgi:hypothetical protein